MELVNNFVMSDNFITTFSQILEILRQTVTLQTSAGAYKRFMISGVIVLRYIFYVTFSELVLFASVVLLIE